MSLTTEQSCDVHAGDGRPVVLWAGAVVLLAAEVLGLTIRHDAGVLITTTTDTNGLYCFMGLRPGNYQICETQPSGSSYCEGINTVGTVNGNCDGGLTGPDTICNISVGSGSTGLHYNFGEFTTQASSISSGQSAVEVKDGRTLEFHISNRLINDLMGIRGPGSRVRGGSSPARSAAGR